MGWMMIVTGSWTMCMGLMRTITMGIRWMMRVTGLTALGQLEEWAIMELGSQGWLGA